jgi:hypothetical protein
LKKGIVLRYSLLTPPLSTPVSRRKGRREDHTTIPMHNPLEKGNHT